jgi:sugar O-acyltransferase (sialic acid O-acetyltransferase NeuD family)
VAQASPILIFGNGAMARVAFSFVRRNEAVAGFTVDDSVLGAETRFCGLPIAPFSRVEQVFAPETRRMLIAVGYRDMNKLRLAKAAEARAKGYRLASYVDPAIIRHDDVEIGENCILLDQVSIHPGCRIGASVFISSNVNLGHDCVIGDGAWINAGVALGGGCKVGAGAVLGVNACVAHGVSIGAHAFIGANTLADRDVAENATLISPGGVPFRLNAEDFLKFARRA